MIFNPHKLGVHKVLQHIPLNVVFDAPYKRALKKAVNIADLRLIAKARAHKVSKKRDTKLDRLALQERLLECAYSTISASVSRELVSLPP
jgi:hypothetical protein